MGWLIGIIVGFGIIFMLFFDLNNISYIVAFPKDSNQFELSFLISVSNFFQIELIEKYQNYTMYLISSFEKILGIIVLSLFTVSYTRKVYKIIIGYQDKIIHNFFENFRKAMNKSKVLSIRLTVIGKDIWSTILSTGFFQMRSIR